MKKIITLILALTFVLMLTVPAFASSPGEHEIPMPSAAACEGLEAASDAWNENAGGSGVVLDFPGPECASG